MEDVEDIMESFESWEMECLCLGEASFKLSGLEVTVATSISSLMSSQVDRLNVTSAKGKRERK